MRAVCHTSLILTVILLSGCVVDPGPIRRSGVEVPSGGIFVDEAGFDGLQGGVHWVSPDGSARSTVLVPNYGISGSLARGMIPVFLSSHFSPNSHLDSLFVFDVKSGALHFVAAYTERFLNGLTIAPDGQHILSWSSGDYETDVSTLRISIVGGRSRILVGDNASFEPTFSPDSRSVAFFRDLPGAKVDMHIIGIDGSGDRLIAQDVDYSYNDPPAWSPDGRNIAFCKQDADGLSEVWSVDVNDGQLMRLSPMGADDRQPQWSPDGTMIACASGPQSRSSRITIFSADGSNRRSVADTIGLADDTPRWSPDGTRLLFLRSAPGASLNTLVMWHLEHAVGLVLSDRVNGSFGWDDR